MSPSEAKELSSALVRKGANHPCPRCGHRHFSLLGDAKVNLSTTPGEGMAAMFGGSVDAVVVGCSNCGYISMHSKSVLREATSPRGLLG